MQIYIMFLQPVVSAWIGSLPFLATFPFSCPQSPQERLAVSNKLYAVLFFLLLLFLSKI